VYGVEYVNLFGDEQLLDDVDSVKDGAGEDDKDEPIPSDESL
jgi:hypothetical protein